MTFDFYLSENNAENVLYEHYWREDNSQFITRGRNFAKQQKEAISLFFFVSTTNICDYYSMVYFGKQEHWAIKIL